MLGMRISYIATDTIFKMICNDIICNKINIPPFLAEYSIHRMLGRNVGKYHVWRLREAGGETNLCWRRGVQRVIGMIGIE